MDVMVEWDSARCEAYCRKIGYIETGPRHLLSLSSSVMYAGQIPDIEDRHIEIKHDPVYDAFLEYCFEWSLGFARKICQVILLSLRW